MLPGKQDESLKAGCLILSIYMKSCWLHGRSLVELHVVSSTFSNEVRGRAAAISFFSLLFLEGIAAIFVLFSQSKECSSQFLVWFSNQVNASICQCLEPPVWSSWLSEVLKTLRHGCSAVLTSSGSPLLLSPPCRNYTVNTLWNLGALRTVFLFPVFKIFSLGCLR